MSHQRVRLAEDLLSFAQLAPKAVSSQHLVRELRRRVEPFGVANFSAGVMADGAKRIKLGTAFGHHNTAWSRVYVESELYRDDPVIRYALTQERSLYWDAALDGVELTKPERDMMGIANEVGVKDGFIVPLPLFNGDIMVVSFQGDRVDDDPDIEAYLRSLALYFGVEGYRLATQSNQKGNLLVEITRRQMEIIHLSATGYTNKAIANELNITVSTVEFHLKRVRDRLGVRNTKEAIAVIHAMSDNDN